MSFLARGKSSKAYYRRMLTKIIIIMVAIMLFLTIVLHFLLNSAVQKNIQNTESGIVQNTSTHACDYLDQLAYISAYFSTIQRNIPLDNLNSETSFWLRKSINDNIASYIFSHDYIDNIYVKIGNLEFNNETMEEIADESIETFVHNNISYAKSPEWPYNLYFSNTNNGNPAFNDVIIKVSSLKLSEKILNHESARFEYLIDKNGTIISSLDTGNLNQNIQSLYHIQDNALTKNFFALKIDGEKYYITIQNIRKTSLKIISFAPESIYTDVINTAWLETIIIGFALQIITIFSCYIIVSKIYKPIRNITETFQYHFPDNMESFENEIEYINAKIQQTITSNKSLEQEFPKAIQKIHRAQVAALQSQINPHFLYNTLENIKIISVNLLDIDNPVEESLILLNNILCESTDQQNIIIPLSREITLTNSYIELMKLRYKNNFDVCWSVDDSLKNYYVLKFIMQPLIENAIIHGFSNIGSNQKITIDIMEQSGDLLIKIADNGSGIPEDKLKKIQRRLQDANTDSESRHIGIWNVHMRIRLLYGNAYGLQIESGANGTTCVLKLPKETHLAISTR